MTQIKEILTLRTNASIVKVWLAEYALPSSNQYPFMGPDTTERIACYTKIFLKSTTVSVSNARTIIVSIQES